jgi:UDP-glucose 4-epimerase
MRMLVTGGRGRLATLIADHFRAPAHEITLFSRHASEGFRPLADLISPPLLSDADVIFHLAWSSFPSTSEQHPDIEWREDLPFLEKLLETMAAVPAARRPQLVFFSSGGAVYGNAPGRPSRESDTCAPVGRYGRAKLAAETLIAARAERDGLDCTILRISNPYGYPVPRNRAQGLIPHALRCATDGQPLALWGDGSARKDFLYYTDFLSALEAVLGQRLTGIFNICAGESHTVSEVIRLIETETSRSIALRYEPAPAWDVHDSCLDHTRFTAATGWQPQVRLTEGVRRASAGYASH